MDPAGFRYRWPGAYSDRTAAVPPGWFDAAVDDGSGNATAPPLDGIPVLVISPASPPEGEFEYCGICSRCRKRMTCLKPSAIAERVLGDRSSGKGKKRWRRR